MKGLIVHVKNHSLKKVLEREQTVAHVTLPCQQKLKLYRTFLYNLSKIAQIDRKKKNKRVRKYRLKIKVQNTYLRKLTACISH